MSHPFSLRLLLLAALVAALPLSGCDFFQEEEEDDLNVPEGVIVGNEGNFSAQNGSLTIYDPQTDQTNNLGSLNALVQSLALRNDRLYTILNNDTNAGRIDVLNTSDDSYNRINQLLFPRPPRTLAFGDGDRAYVPAQTLVGGVPAESITYLISLDPLAITDSVAVGPQPEDALVTQGKVFVANYGSLGGGETLSVIDAGSGESTDPIDLGCDGPSTLFEDDEEEVIVICGGETIYNDDYTAIEAQTPGQVLFVDAQSETVTRRLDDFDVQLGAATYADASEELFVAGGGGEQIFRIDTDANARASIVEVPADDGLSGLGALAYDAADQRLYLARRDAGSPYETSGTVVIMERSDAETFEQTGEFVAGIVPSSIVFRR